jgi:hypothetical protein
LSALLVLAFSANGSMPFHIVFKYATERWLPVINYLKIRSLLMCNT